MSGIICHLKKSDLLLKVIKYKIYQTAYSFFRERKLVLETHSAGNQVTKAVKKQASDNRREDTSLNASTCVLGNVCVGPSLMRQPKAKIYLHCGDARYQYILSCEMCAERGHCQRLLEDLSVT